jgi:hypothetical protein
VNQHQQAGLAADQREINRRWLVRRRAANLRLERVCLAVAGLGGSVAVSVLLAALRVI